MNTRYYVSSVAGSDANHGTSPESPLKSLEAVNALDLQPGDRVLFQRGTAYFGRLVLARDGSDANPILIGAYGDGELPQIIARKEDENTVEVYAQHIVLSELGIQNPTGSRGLYLTGRRAGASVNIVIRECCFHNITSETYHHETGGIVVRSDGGEPCWFEDVVIEDNTFLDVSRSGIFITGLWADRPVPGWGKNRYVSDEEGWYPHRRITVRRNRMDYIGGDGIVVIGTAGCVLEHNRLFHAQCDDHTGNFCAGIWPMNCNDVLVQFNEVGYTKLGKGGDGQGFDIDSNCKNVLFQYNYSHHNDGGFLLICSCQFNEGIVVRYNVSVNDTRQRGRSVFTVSGPNTGADIYNNTIYLGEGSAYDFKLVEAADYQNCGPSKDFRFRNNLFYVEKDRVVSGYFDQQTGFVFDNNVYWGMQPFTHGNITVTRARCVQPEFTGRGLTGEGRAAAGAYSIAPISGADAIADPAEGDFFGRPAGNAPFYGAIRPEDHDA